MSENPMDKALENAVDNGIALGRAMERERCRKIAVDFGRFHLHFPHNLEIAEAINDEKAYP